MTAQTNLHGCVFNSTKNKQPPQLAGYQETLLQGAGTQACIGKKSISSNSG